MATRPKKVDNALQYFYVEVTNGYGINGMGIIKDYIEQLEAELKTCRANQSNEIRSLEDDLFGMEDDDG